MFKTPNPLKDLMTKLFFIVDSSAFCPEEVFILRVHHFVNMFQHRHLKKNSYLQILYHQLNVLLLP